MLEEKLQNSENNVKNKAKDLAELIELKESLEKRITELETDINNSKNELNK